MANKSPTEICLMKGVAVKLDADVVFTLGYLVHTEEHNRAKSEYLYAGRIDKTADILAEAENMNTDANKLSKWQWKGLQNYTSVVYDKDDTNARGSRWHKGKIKKAVEWDQFLKIIDGWNDKKQAYNSNAKYATENYVADDGTEIKDLHEAKDVLLKLVGKTIQCKLTLKSMI